MHILFIENNSSLEEIVKYGYYLKYFSDNFGYRFGRSQVDVCLYSVTRMVAKIETTR